MLEEERVKRKRRTLQLLKQKADPTSKYWKKKADTLFSKLVRRAGRCEYCGRTDHLNCSHLIPKESLYTRWIIDAAVCLCANHHKFSRTWSFHRNPAAFFLWFSKKFPLRWKTLQELLDTANSETGKEAYERLQKEE